MDFRLILAFGTNIGDLEQNFVNALRLFPEFDPSFKILTQSQCHLTSPFQSMLYDVKHQDNYLNFVCDVTTKVNPFDFYSDCIVKIEDQLGHSRVTKWQPRVLDVDILMSAYDQHKDFQKCQPFVIKKLNFHIPHKELLNPERIVIKNMLKNELNLDDECIKCHSQLAAQVCEKK